MLCEKCGLSEVLQRYDISPNSQNKTQEKVITMTKYILDNELDYGAVQEAVSSFEARTLIGLTAEKLSKNFYKN